MKKEFSVGDSVSFEGTHGFVKGIVTHIFKNSVTFNVSEMFDCFRVADVYNIGINDPRLQKI